MHWLFYKQWSSLQAYFSDSNAPINRKFSPQLEDNMKFSQLGLHSLSWASFWITAKLKFGQKWSKFASVYLSSYTNNNGMVFVCHEIVWERVSWLVFFFHCWTRQGMRRVCELYLLLKSVGKRAKNGKTKRCHFLRYFCMAYFTAYCLAIQRLPGQHVWNNFWTKIFWTKCFSAKMFNWIRQTC